MITGCVLLKNPKKAVRREYCMLALWTPFATKLASKSSSAERTELYWTCLLRAMIVRLEKKYKIVSQEDVEGQDKT